MNILAVGHVIMYWDPTMVACSIDSRRETKIVHIYPKDIAAATEIPLELEDGFPLTFSNYIEVLAPYRSGKMQTIQQFTVQYPLTTPQVINVALESKVDAIYRTVRDGVAQEGPRWRNMLKHVPTGTHVCTCACDCVRMCMELCTRI